MKIRLRVLDQSVQSYWGGTENSRPISRRCVDAKILSPKSILDPWGKRLHEDISGKKTKNEEVAFDIWTETPDKKIIGNWSE